MKAEPFEPKILAFFCNWCTYGAADLAGVSRLQYPPNVRPIRVMCSATVSPHHVLRAFQSGADGVLVGGCHVGDCHYIYGNYMTIKRIRFLQELLEFVGLGERLHLEWISSAEAQKFVQVVTEFTLKIKELGPSPLTVLSKGLPAMALSSPPPRENARAAVG
ncbi:MAG: hydrogenase iron-sulfur subunit [Deltaproteobacteria bacterium]|nr:hydrogenase iron-sulfur subunit [Deltaproteobacteria bacterium]